MQGTLQNRRNQSYPLWQGTFSSFDFSEVYGLAVIRVYAYLIS